ncbi:hypothetical protein PAMP_003523 [Pampus punctatissimus]
MDIMLDIQAYDYDLCVSVALPRGYYVRWRAVDHCVKRFLQITENCPILSLGAGFDSLYFRLHAGGALDRAVVFEVDFPDVTRRKAALITSNITLKGMLDPHLPSLTGVDVRDESQVEEALRTAGVQWAAPTLILSEVVLTYMETQRSDAVISWTAKLLPQSIFVMYEQIRPGDPFGRIMQDHFLKLNSTLHALQQYPDAAAQTHRFLDLGWEQCVCLDMNDFYLKLVAEEERCRVESLEPFDEYECEQLVVVFPPGVRLYHTATSVPGGGTVVYGGRSSPLNPVRGLFKVTIHPCSPAGPLDSEDQDAVKLCEERIVCTGDPPPPRWRHTATTVCHKGEDFLFVFGGKNQSEAVLGDGCFLCLEQQHWTEINVEGAVPEARHSHSACSYQGGAVVFGGLGQRGAPLGDTVVLRPIERGFCWERLQVEPPPFPRYSHSAHVIGDKLVVVGGVWLHSDGVPGVAVINLTTGSSVEFSLETTSVPWPLMLHSFCSELTDQKNPELLLIGGGGNCFSFGTHFNPQPVTVDLRPVLG